MGQLVAPDQRVYAVKGQHRDGSLDVTCWCEAQVVRVSLDDVLEGRTRSCGQPGCRPKDTA